MATDIQWPSMTDRPSKPIQPLARIVETDEDGNEIILDAALVTGKDARRNGMAIGVKLAADFLLAPQEYGPGEDSP